MDFVVGLPRSQAGHDGIWVIVDRRTKTSHFLPFKTRWSVSKLAELFISEIVRLHRVLVSIVSDRDPRFTSCFWHSFQEALDTELHMSSAYHPQSDGAEREDYSDLGGYVEGLLFRLEGQLGRVRPLGRICV